MDWICGLPEISRNGFTYDQVLTTTDNVTKNIVKHIVKVPFIIKGTELFKQIDRSDDSTAGATDAWLGTTRFHAEGLAVSRTAHILQLHILSLLAERIEDCPLGQTAQQEPGEETVCAGERVENSLCFISVSIFIGNFQSPARTRLTHKVNHNTRGLPITLFQQKIGA